MSRWFPTPVIAAVVALAMAPDRTPCLAQTATPPRPVAPAAEKPADVPEEADATTDDPWEERKLRAREDVEYLEIHLKAKQAEFREAELRYAQALSWKADMDRQHQKGYTPTFNKNLGELSVAESLTQREMRRAELKDAEIRLARSRRRLRAVERSGSAIEPEGSQAEDRLRELELRFDRLREQFERTKRTDDAQRRKAEQDKTIFK